MTDTFIIETLNIVEDQLWQLSLPKLESEEEKILFPDYIPLIKEEFKDLEPFMGRNSFSDYFKKIKEELSLLTPASDPRVPIRLAVLVSVLTKAVGNQFEWTMAETRLARAFHPKINLSQLGLTMHRGNPDEILKQIL